MSKNKTLRNFSVLLVIFLVLALLTRVFVSPSKKVSNKQTATVEKNKNVLSSEKEKEEEKDASDSSSLVKVVRVIDGDTIEIEGGERVRYIGIDAPETNQNLECFATESAAKNSELVLNKEVLLEKDISETDRYQRLLRNVRIGDVFVNEELVREGFARVSTFPPDIKYKEKLIEAERLAKANNKGLWGSCAKVAGESTTELQSDSPTFSNTNTSANYSESNNKTETSSSEKTKTSEKISTPPSPYCHATESSSCKIKGNINDKKEKIYHIPGCGSYKKTVINPEDGECWFCTEAEASAAGWRKAGNCPKI